MRGNHAWSGSWDEGQTAGPAEVHGVALLRVARPAVYGRIRELVILGRSAGILPA